LFHLAMAFRKFFLALLFLIFINPAFGDHEDEFESEIEGIISDAVIEDLEELRENPININSATVYGLRKIPWISARLAEKIVEKRIEIGEFKNLEQFKETVTIGDNTFQKILPYIKVEPIYKREREPIAVRLRTRLIEKIPSSKEGPGNPLKHYNSMKIDYRDRIFLNLLTEKDPFESNYLDFFRVFVSIKFAKIIDELAIGHYGLEFGEGLIFNYPWPVMKVANVFKNRERGIRPYRSSGNENRSLLGLAIKAHTAKFTYFVFASYEPHDCSLKGDSVASIKFDEIYHTTEGTIKGKDGVTRKLWGARLLYGENNFKVGTTVYRSWYSSQFNILSFPPSIIAGIDFDYIQNDVNIFGELGTSWGESNDKGILLGFSYKLLGLSLISLFRDYGPNFVSPEGMGFCDNRENQNEGGYFNKVSYRISKHTQLAWYFDIFNHRRISPIDDVTYRKEVRAEFTHQFAPEFACRVQYKYKDKDRMQSGCEKREGARFDISMRPNNDIFIRSRFESVEYTGNTNEDGFLYYIDSRYRRLKWLSVEARCIYFDTDSYNSRVYEYENNLTGTITNEALFGKGFRSYLLVSWRVKENVGLQMRYALEKKESIVSTYGIQIDVALN
jgi:hypothetical protein